VLDGGKIGDIRSEIGVGEVGWLAVFAGVIAVVIGVSIVGSVVFVGVVAGGVFVVDFAGDGEGNIAAAAHCVGVVDSVEVAGEGGGEGSIAAGAHCVDVIVGVEIVVGGVGSVIDEVVDGGVGVGAIAAVMYCLMSVCVIFGTKDSAEGFSCIFLLPTARSLYLARNVK